MSANQVELPAEINIHIPGIQNAARPGVFVFPKILVCLSCGHSSFPTPPAELALLAGVAPAQEPATRQSARVAVPCQSAF